MKKVLIVEANQQLASHWTALLERDGLQVIHEVSTPAALDCLAASQVDLVISDMVIPDASGIPSPNGGLLILAFIALNIDNPPKVLAVSGLDTESSFFATFKLLDQGKVLLKPVADETLLERTRALLAEREQEMAQLTAAKRFQRELLQNKFATDHASHGVFWLGKDSSILYANLASEKMLGYSNQELCQMSVSDINVEFPITNWETVWRKWSQPGSHCVETVHKRCDGSTYECEVTFSYLSFENEEFLLASFQDITERLVEQKRLLEYAEQQKKHSEELVSINAQLARSNQDLGQFAHVASHDLQEPLRAISGFLQLLKERYHNQLDDKANGYIDKSVDGVTRMKQLINDLLHYSKVTRDESDFVRVELAKCVELACVKLDQLVLDSGAKIEIGELPLIDGIESLLVQMFQNLIENAIKYRDEEPPHIRVFSEQDSSGFLVHVQDNGIGIAPEYQEQIFALFKRLHHREEHSGTGIGLTICQRVAERHGGTISVKSSEGSGSCFTLRFPDLSGCLLS